MNKRSSALARVFAVTTLVVALVVAIAVIGGALGGGSSNDSDGNGHNKAAQHAKQRKRENIPATYEVKSGDTLISIAHRNGITVARIEALNPAVDPQILIAGEQLKLR